MTEVTITYTEPETGRAITEKIRVFDDQIDHFMEFAREMDEQTQGY